MVSGRHKSRTYRRVFRKTPGGRTVMQFKKRKPSKAKCSVCRKSLYGVPRERPNNLKRFPKSQRSPERPYGGVLCSACMRNKLIKEARK